jgi:hypothetical protein
MWSTMVHFPFFMRPKQCDHFPMFCAWWFAPFLLCTASLLSHRPTLGLLVSPVAVTTDLLHILAYCATLMKNSVGQRKILLEIGCHPQQRNGIFVEHILLYISASLATSLL